MKVHSKREEPLDLRSKTRRVLVLLFLFFGVLFLRIWYLQVVKGEEYKRLSENNRIRLVIAAPPRGRIFDREGRLLVGNRPSFNLTLIPEDVRDWKGLKERLSLLIPGGVEFDGLKRDRRLPFEPLLLKRDMEWEEVARIEVNRFDLPGVSIDVESMRYYPYGKSLAHVLGYMGEIDRERLQRTRFGDYRVGDMVGKRGIERLWEESLRGIRGGYQVEVDALGRTKRVLKEVAPIPGKDIYLTIDLDLQEVAEKALGDRAGAVIAMDPRNGEILAMVSSPSYDPNLFAKGMDRDTWKALVTDPRRPLENKAIQGQYPPASTFKVVTAAAALEEGIIRPGDRLFSGPYFILGNRVFRDWKEQGHGFIDIHRAIVESADTFFYQLGLELGVDRIARYARAFGFGVKTGIDLDGEKPGLVPTKEWKGLVFNEPWYKGETLPVAVGQGYLLATPLQVLNAYAAIANGGRLLQPHVVKEVRDREGHMIYRARVKEKDRVPVSRKNLEIIKRALWGAVNEKGGTGRTAMIKGFDVAGKTGTAQVVGLREGGDLPYRLRDHSWFVGFAPYGSPEIAVVVLVEHGGFGATTAAPIAKKVIEAYLTKGHRDGSR